jgi:hypothetical protein
VAGAPRPGGERREERLPAEDPLDREDLLLLRPEPVEGRAEERGQEEEGGGDEAAAHGRRTYSRRGPAGPGPRRGRLDPVPDRPPPPDSEPVRLVGTDLPSPFVPGRDVAFAKVSGEGLCALDVRDGDHVVLVRRDGAEHGDVAAVLDDEGRATLWKVYPEGDRLRLSSGRPEEAQRTGRHPKVHGVVVALARKFAEPGQGASSSSSTT